MQEEMAPMFHGGASASTDVPAVPAEHAATEKLIEFRSPVIEVPEDARHKPEVPEEAQQVVGAVRVRPRPQAPTSAEVEAHEGTHHPYRSWCRHCVAGAGRRDGHAHASSATRDDGIVTVSCDYCSFNDGSAVGEPATKHTPIPVSYTHLTLPTN